jgi:hypothetical protein
VKRVVVVSGACGVGKSETLRAMHTALDGRVGDVAVLETDHFYTMVDPHWEMRPDRAPRYFEVTGHLLRQTARGFLRAGFDLVAIGSNGLHEEAHVREFVEPFVADGAAAHHVTLDPGLETVQERMAHRIATRGLVVDDEKDPEWLAGQLSWFRERYGPWTFVLDNSSLSPAETAVAIYDAVRNDRGRLD